MDAATAVNKLLHEHVLPHGVKVEHPHVFREKQLWREEVDLVFRRHHTKLAKVFDMYAGRFCRPGTSAHGSSTRVCVRTH